MAGSWGLPAKEEEGKVGRSFPVRGRVTVQFARTSRRPFLASHRFLKTLTSCSHHQGMVAPPHGLSNI